ncbi:hypothetical protein [Limosilactobacillus vaginalis]|uniref:hypothetical protein n=1 Tax=Limosilactobacillus vaginalis TaxID=1633 RepID=UPI0013DE54C4|nr:hypothetical protein [Limosilactobacillus vaginalis]
MVEKVSQADSNNSGLPNVPAVAPTSDTPYIQPVIGKLGYDTKHPEIFGLGSSPDNGASFHVWASFGGIVLDKDNMDAIWINGVSDRVKSEVNSATAEIPVVKSAADEAVKKADSAIASSKVNSDAIVAQSEAISEAKAAMERATAEIQQTASNAASDAAKIRADVAQVQNEVDTAKAANSASVEALKSDIDTAKQDLANVHDSLTKAQSAVEQNQKLINDSVAKISNDIAQDRKGLATAQQNNADLAKQLDDYSKQAEAQGKTIKSIQDKQDSFTATLADVQGNVSQVSDKVDGLSASLKDTQGNVATVKAQADQLNATLTDHAKSIATLTASAKELSSTLEDADGRLSKVEQTAQTNSSTLSDVQGDLSQVKQQADGLVTTLKDAQGSITQIQQKADGTLAQLKNAQGDIASLQTDVTGIKATLVSHEGDIHTLQADSKSLHDSMQDAQGDISTLKKTSTDVTSELKDHAGRISKTEQTASTLVNEFADQQGHLNRVEQKATGTEQTVANQQGQINNIKTDAAGMHQTITGHGNQIANINVTLSGLNTKYEGVSGDLSNLSNKAMQNRGTVNSPDFNSLTQAGYYTVTLPINGKNYPTGNWGTLEVSGQVSDINGRLNQKYVGDNGGGTYTRQYNASAKSWTGWLKEANQNDINNLSGRISSNTTAINQNKLAIALKADQTVVDAVKNTASQNSSRLDVMANEISSKVTSTDVNNIVNGKGYATTSTVQSLVDQKAGTISESITNLEQTVKQGAENNVQLVRKSEFEDGSKGSWNAQMIVSATNPAPPAELGQSGMKVLQSNTRDAYEVDVWYSVKPGEKFDVDFWCVPSTVYNSNFGLVFVDKNKGNPNWLGIVTDHSGAWKHYTGTITAPTNAAFARPWFQIDKDSSNTSNTAWLAKPSIRRQNATTVAAIQQITASIDGIQSTVANKADQSQITQLTNVVQSKVSSKDYQTAISQLTDDINARVAKGDLITQINLEAGRALFQSKKLFLDADSVVFSGKAFIPSAAITSLEADKITTGTLNGVHIHQIANANGRSIDIANGNISLNSSDPYESRISFTNNGKDAKMFNAVGDIEVLNQEFALFNFTPEDTHSLNPIPFFKVTNTGQIGSGGAQLNMDHAIFDGYEWWTPSAGVTFGRTWNGVDKSSDYADIYAKSFVPHSELSAKTRIKKLDRKEALDKIMQDDMYTYQFKEDVRDGVSKRYASFIIDNIHDVAQYTEPEEFLSANGKGRDDGTQLAYLIAAVQYQQEQIEELKKKLEEK